MKYQSYLNTLLQNQKQGVIVVDKEAKIVYLKNIVDLEFKDVVKKNAFDILGEIVREDSEIRCVLETGIPLYNHIRPFSRGEKTNELFVTNVYPIYEEGNLVGAMEIMESLEHCKNRAREFLEWIEVEEQREEEKKTHQALKNGTGYTMEDLIGRGEENTKLKRKILKIADSPSPVFVYGETGTGKELVAQAIHNGGKERKKHRFIAQNCAAIPKELLESILFGTVSGSFTGAKEKPGLFELADGGTLLLDEINSMDLDLQAKLLRVLQDGKIRRLGGEKTISTDVRVIATSNEMPLDAVKRGKLREDLYYRLNVLSIQIPPLRERKQDVLYLANYYLEKYNRSLGKKIKGFSEPCKALLLEYSWPGNVRELQYTLESMIHFAEKELLEVKDLPEQIVGKKEFDFSEDQEEQLIPLKEVVEHLEKNMILKALTKTQGNRSKCARILGIPRQSLNNKISRYHILENYQALEES